MWKSTVGPEWSQMNNTLRHMHLECRITKATDSLGLCNSYYFFTAVMVTRTHLNVIFIRTWPVYFRVTPSGLALRTNHPPALRVCMQPSCSCYLSLFKDCRFVTVITKASPQPRQFTQYSLISLSHIIIPDVGLTKTHVVGSGILCCVKFATRPNIASSVTL